MIAHSLTRDNAGTVDWGHLNADRVNMDPKYAQYDLVDAGAEEAGPPPGSAVNLPPPPSAGLKKQQKLQKAGQDPLLVAYTFTQSALQLVDVSGMTKLRWQERLQTCKQKADHPGILS